MILIATTNIPSAIAAYRGQYKGLSRCRMVGTHRETKAKARVVHRAALAHVFTPGDVIIWFDFVPTPEERKIQWMNNN